MQPLKGKVAVITGAASGIGRASAILFAQSGANVVVADLNVKGGEEAAALCSESGNQAVFQKTDVASEADVAALIGRATSTFGRLDILFNNAGFGGAAGPIEDVPVEDWDRTIAVCVRGTFLGIKHAVRPMRAAGGGAIVSTASTVGLRGFADLVAYSTAKAAVINLTRSAALQLAPDMIRVNCIAPGVINTPGLVGRRDYDREAQDAINIQAQPLPVAGQPEDIAQAALFLASDAARFITGETVVVDGGVTVGAKARPREGARRGFTGPSFEN
jgi:NAD(P)-dependent dehydrogenase (short-subunit alcohol dehydrogenase family)